MAFDLYKLQWASQPVDSEYMGCYRDMTDRRLMTDMIWDESMTPSLCRQHCEGTGAMYYGTQVLLIP